MSEGVMHTGTPDLDLCYIVHLCRYTPKVLEEMEMRFDKQRQARRRHMYS